MHKNKTIFSFLRKEFVYGGHLLSLGAVSIIASSAMILGISVTWDFLILMYLGPQSIYLYNRYKEFHSDQETNPQRTKHLEIYINKLPKLIFILFLLFIIIILFFSKWELLLLGVLFIFLGFLYSTFFKKWTIFIPGFKNIFVSFCWTLLVLFLIKYYSLDFNLGVFLLMLFVFLRIFIHEVCVDFKDLKTDTRQKLLVFPRIIKKERLLKILAIISCLSFFPIFLGYYLGIFSNQVFFLILLLPYSFFYLIKIKNNNKNKDFLYNVIIDGELIFWFPIIYLGKIIL